MFKLANIIGYGGLALLVIAVLCLAGWAGGSCQRHRATQQVEAVEAAHDTRAAAEPAQQHHFDSTVYVRIGEHRALTNTLAKIKRLDDSLHNRLPAAPALPASPPRQ